MPNDASTTAHGSHPDPLVLLVDDSEDSREMYSVFLVRRGFQVAEASTGRGAIDQAARLSPDVIVMDLSLPDIDGMSAIQQIKNNPKKRDPVILVVSGHGAPPTDARTWDGYLTKPCLPDALEREIRRALGARSSASA
jgi:two-component system, cell cycle response regulator DivK